jgi:thiol-disulfide isomerase/thioredoxin
MKRKMACLVFMAVLTCAFCTEALGSEAGGDRFPVFLSRTLDGEPITDAIFTTKKITMVNIWATWCPPCRAELPDLGRLGRSMPEETQLIGIVRDVSTERDSSKDKAKQLLDDAKADFLQVLYTPQMQSYFRKAARLIPTTVFVDSKGQIIGKPIVGSKSEAKYRTALKETLERVERRMKLEKFMSEF